MRIRNRFRRGGDPARHSLVGGIKNNPCPLSCGYVETLLTDENVRGHASHNTNAAAIIAQPSTASPIAAHKASVPKPSSFGRVIDCAAPHRNGRI
jgi:hypothetical protein